MEQLNVKNVSTSLVSFVVFSLMLSGIYNSFFGSFKISESVFDDSEYSISIVSSSSKRQVVPKLERRRKSYSRRGDKSFQSAAKVSSVERDHQDIKEKAHIKTELNLELAEFYNSKHFKKVLKGNEAEGSLVARDGVIESLEIFLPNSDEISAQFAEMNGNVFTYHHGGEIFSGLIYQSSNNDYTVTLVNGPYQGSKVKFVSRDYGQRALSYDENLGYEETMNPAVNDMNDVNDNRDVHQDSLTRTNYRDDYAEEEFIDEKPSFADEVFEQAATDDTLRNEDRYSEGA